MRGQEIAAAWARGAVVFAAVLAGCSLESRPPQPAAQTTPGTAAAGAAQTTPGTAAAGAAQTTPGTAAAGAAQTTPGTADGTPAAGGTAGRPRGGAAAEVYRQAGASVVNITSVGVVRTAAGVAAQPQGTGSGFVLDDRGHIVTNNHVVQEADQLTVTFPDRTTVPGRLVGRDPDNDLAVLQVDRAAAPPGGRPVAELLKPVALGDSDRITIGEEAIAIGSPLGLQQTVTSGIVSALRTPEEDGAAALLLGGAVQTDAAINPGNSGGPLFNAAGEVIGVNTAGLSQSGGSIGLNFAIPVNVVKRVVPELIRSGCYRHPAIGISGLPLAQLGQGTKRQLGLPLDQGGLLVQEATAGAAQAGVRAGDRVVDVGGTPLRVGGDTVVAVDGRPLGGGGDLRGYIENTKRPGDAVTLTVLRSGQRQDVRVTLTERPSEVPCR
jgi:2-alkenal reductase